MHKQCTKVALLVAIVLAMTLGVAKPSEAAVPANIVRRVVNPGDPGASTAIPAPPPAVTQNWQNMVYLYSTNKASYDAWVFANLYTLQVPPQPACRGQNGYSWYETFWQGHVDVVSLDSCKTAILKAAMGSGVALFGVIAAITTLSVAGIPLAVIAVTLAGISAVAGFALTICSTQGTGTDIRHQSTLSLTWCNNQ